MNEEILKLAKECQLYAHDEKLTAFYNAARAIGFNEAKEAAVAVVLPTMNREGPFSFHVEAAIREMEMKP